MEDEPPGAELRLATFEQAVSQVAGRPWAGASDVTVFEAKFGGELAAMSMPLSNSVDIGAYMHATFRFRGLGVLS